ncbi:putative nuclease HARBI1 [Asterias amurensis]|uniref:putative nuclease HARBI1 n=1 Tax=Asterias amurensis TaxID=7602 RepID=UPI003AB34334
MAALLRRRRHVEENQRNYPIQRQRRVFRDRQNPLELFTPVQIWARYRFRPATIVGLAQALSAELEHPTDNNHALPPLLQVCLALRYLSSGTFAIVVGDTCPVVSPPTAWRAIDRTVNTIGTPFDYDLKMFLYCSGFEHYFQNCSILLIGFPNVIGAVDCTHVRVEPPSELRNEFVNRKGYTSLNCQMVCDHRKRFTNVVVKFPGAAHDSRVWRESSLGVAMEAGRCLFFLGYKVEIKFANLTNELIN